MKGPPVVAPASPYKGLAPFDDSDVDAFLFFGREVEIEVIAANVLASRLTVLHGPSGVGKSSVLRAGVVRRVRELAPDSLVLLHDAWAGDAVASLRGAVTAAYADEHDADPSTPLSDRLDELAARVGGHVYLVLDQFEELFTYGRADAVAADLAEVVTGLELRVHVLVSLREDALSELDVFTGLIPDVFGNHLALARLDREAGRAAVTGPIARYGRLSPEHTVELEPGLVEAVLDEVEVGGLAAGAAARAGAPASRGGIEAPYLQLVMQRLWEAERGSPVLRRATLEELGGAEGIVRAHLDRALDGLATGERDLAARAFNHLVTPSGTKIAHRVADLAEYTGAPEDAMRSVLAFLGRERILRPLDGRFELFHDVLADAVLAWRARYEAGRALERQRAESDRRQRRLLALLAAALVGLAAMAAVTVYALTQRGEAHEQAGAARDAARRASARSLDAQASVVIPVVPAEVDPELGLLLAARAARMAPTVQATDILRRALLASHLRRVLPEREVTAASLPSADRILVTAGGTVHLYSGDGLRRLVTLDAGPPLGRASSDAQGRFVLTTETAGPARLWDTATGTPLRSFGAAPTAAHLSPDASLVLTVEPDDARVWRASDGTSVARLRQPDSAVAASFGPRGRLIWTVGDEGVARVFSARTGRLAASVAHGGDVTAAALTPDERALVTAGRDKVARVWKVPGGRLVHELAGHAGELTGVVVSQDGALLATTSTDSTARVWELRSGRLLHDLVGHTNHVGGAAFSEDARSLVTWSSDRTARVWRVDRGSVRATLSGHGDAVTSASFGSSGGTALTTSADGLARLWRLPPAPYLRPVAQVPAPVAAASISGDGKVAAAAARRGVSILPTAGGRSVALLPVRGARAVALDRTGTLVAVAAGRRIFIWRVGAAGARRAAELDVGGTPTAVALGGRSLLAAGTSRGAIGVWTLDGRRFASVTPAGPRVTSLVLGAPGRRLIAGLGDGTIAAWSMPGGRPLYRRAAHRPGTAVTSVSFDESGRLLATTGRDTEAQVWDARSGRRSATLHGHFAAVSDGAFSPDGRWLVTAGPGSAGLWDLPSRQRLIFLDGHEGLVLAASFAASGRRIVTVGADGTLRSYTCEMCGGTSDLLELASRRLAGTGRTLTPAERQRYLGG